MKRILFASCLLVVLVVISVTLGVGREAGMPMERDLIFLEDPRVKIAREECDLDLSGDGRCTSHDTVLLREAIGACRGDTHYRELIDADQDGCISWIDQEQLFPMFKDNNPNRKPCDMNGDGNCDWSDWRIYATFERYCFHHKPVVTSHGSRRGYNPLADANRDGCVFADDQKILFPIIPER